MALKSVDNDAASILGHLCTSRTDIDTHCNPQISIQPVLITWQSLRFIKAKTYENNPNIKKL